MRPGDRGPRRRRPFYQYKLRSLISAIAAFADPLVMSSEASGRYSIFHAIPVAVLREGGEKCLGKFGNVRSLVENNSLVGRDAVLVSGDV